MKLRKIIAGALAVVMMFTAVQLENLSWVRAAEERTSISANDSDWNNYLLLNRYGDSGNYFGANNQNDMRWDYPSLYGEMFGIYSGETNQAQQNRWPYIAFKVTPERSGEYQITTSVNIRTDAIFNTFGMIVDGAMHVLEVDSTNEGTNAKPVELSKNVYLTAGEEHVVVFTTPMPRDAKTAEGYIHGSATSYPWFNYHSFSLSDGLSFSGKPSTTEIQNAMTSYVRIEAEDETYVTYNGNYGTDISKEYSVQYNTIGEKSKKETYIVSGVSDGAIDASVASTEKNVNTTQTYDAINTRLDKKLTSYVQYVVNATATGTYNIRVGAYVEGSGTMPYGTITVNDKAYKAHFSGDWNGYDAVNLAVELKAGINVIRCVGVTADQTSSNGWIGYDYLDISNGLTIVNAATTTINANNNNSSKLLYNKYTAVGSELQNRVNDSIKVDYGTVATLEYAGNKIENWPFAAIKVNAQTDGYYDITVKAAPNTNTSVLSKQIGMLVDGSAYSLPFTVGGTTLIDASVYLEAGTHVLTFTSPIPNNVSDLTDDVNADAWILYPWFNFKNIVLGAGLTLEAKPEISDITSKLVVTYDAIDKARVIYDNYNNHNTNNNGMVTGANANYLKDNRISLETLLDAGWEKAPYTAFEVTVDEAGEYDVFATVKSRNDLTSEQLGMVIDGKEVKDVKVKASVTRQLVGDKVHLEKGTHLIAFTSPMPKTDAEAQAITDPSTDSWAAMNKAYPQFYVYKFYFGKGMTISDDFEVEALTESVQDTAKVSKNWCSYKDSDNDNVSDYLGAITNDLKTNRISVEKLSESELTRVPYTSITVSADADGYYDVFASIKTNGELTSKCAAMIVDGTTVYPISVVTGGKQQKIGAFVPLSKGTHTIAITSAMPKTDAEAKALTDPNTDNWAAMNKAYPWFDFYSFTVNGRLSVVNGQENQLKDKKVLFVGDDFTAEKDNWTSNIVTWNHMTSTNAAVKGATVTTATAKHILHQLKIHKQESYDYILVQGGINDALDTVEVGEVANSYNVTDFDNTTFAGALETTFYYAYEYYDGAKLGYVIPNSDFGGNTQDMSTYFDVAKKICVKWNIPYIDLSEEDKFVSLSVEAWMQTLVANSNPLIEENRKKLIDAGDETKVLFNGFTASEGELKDRKYDGMAEDEANLELLPYAKDLLGDWAFASIKVNAKEAGNYKLMVEIAAKNATQIGMLVDGDAYALNYDAKNQSCQFLSNTVYLTKGVHYITFTAAMPKEAVDVVGDAWNIYPWTNISTIVIDAALEVMDKPELADVTGLLNTINEKGETVIAAGNESKVLAKNFADKGDTLGDMDAGDLRWDSLTLEQVTYDSLERMPYFALKVTAEEDGYYDILLDIDTNSKTVSDQLGLLVDGKNMHILTFEVAENTKVKATVYLEKGTHTLTFTSPMPETIDEFKAYLKQYNEEHDEELKRGNGTTHPWMDVNSITLSKGLKAEAAPSTDEIETPFYNRIEAENSDYVIYNNYEPKAEANKKASGGNVIGGQTKWMFDQSFEDMKVWLDPGHTSYVEYAVIAPEDGDYNIRVGYLAGTKDKAKEKPYIAVLVNDKTYKAQFSEDWDSIDKVELTVTMKKGLNIIRCTSITTDQECYKVSTWINQDFLDIDKSLTAVKRSQSVLEAEDSKYINKIKVQDGSDNEKASKDKVLGGMSRIYVSSLEMTIDSLKADQMKMVPYFSYTINAPMDGYYTMRLNMAGDGRAPKNTLPMFVDGEKETVRYSRLGRKTADSTGLITIYLTEGDHVFTFLCPMPLNSTVEANYSYCWMNFDYLTLYDGLTLSKEQKVPTNIADMVKVETEETAMPNLTKLTETGAGSAAYRRAQTVSQIKKDGIDSAKTPFVEYTINASETGEYTLYFATAYGMTNKSLVDKIDANVVVENNGNLHVKTVKAEKGTTVSRVLPVTLKLQKGSNTVRVTHFTGDSLSGDGLSWNDFDYVEMSADTAKKLSFASNSIVLEAEKSVYVSYTPKYDKGASDGAKLGKADYNYMDENDITFENLDEKNLDDIPRVTYNFIAEKAGTYTVSIGFNAGLTNYNAEEMKALGKVGFAMIVNDGEKQLVEYELGSTSQSMSRLLTVDLVEGENQITFTTTLAEYMTDVYPRVEGYHLVWIDHDYLQLSSGLSLGDEADVYGLEDSDYDHAQMSVKEVTDKEVDAEVSMELVIGLVSLGLLIGLIVIIILLKKRKKKEV